MTTQRQVPRGPDGLDCPEWKKPMAKVCHKCPKWISIKMDHPQTGEQIDRWECADTHNTIILVDILRKLNGVQAATESRGNDTIKMLGESILRSERQHREAMGMLSNDAPAVSYDAPEQLKLFSGNGGGH